MARIARDRSKTKEINEEKKVEKLREALKCEEVLNLHDLLKKKKGNKKTDFSNQAFEQKHIKKNVLLDRDLTKFFLRPGQTKLFHTEVVEPVTTRPNDPNNLLNDFQNDNGIEEISIMGSSQQSQSQGKVCSSAVQSWPVQKAQSGGDQGKNLE